MWIMKPSDGSKGRHIEVFDDKDEVLAHVGSFREGSVSWVVQRYVANPMLLVGGRKFDVRCWVLVDRDYNVFLHREGVLRTTSVPSMGAAFHA